MDEYINHDLVLILSETTHVKATCFATKSNEIRFELEVNTFADYFGGLNLSSV